MIYRNFDTHNLTGFTCIYVSRSEAEIVIRARLGAMFAAKDSERRRAEWRRRGVLQGGDLPAPSLNLAGEN